MSEYYFSEKDEPLVLNDYLRTILLTEICKRMDISIFFDSYLKLPLKYAGTKGVGICPWCHTTGSFTVNKKNGTCSCRNCSRKSDLLNLVSKYQQFTHLNGALEYITGYLESQDKYSKKEKKLGGLHV